MRFVVNVDKVTTGPFIAGREAAVVSRITILVHYYAPLEVMPIYCHLLRSCRSRSGVDPHGLARA
jgi:hypothetical protein